MNSATDVALRLPPWRLIGCVFLPFAAGYYLSYLFRTINALVSGPLSTELGIDAADLGLLTSVYFLAFAGAQIPIGILLDRYGPRCVQSALLLAAAVGAGLFGTSTGLLPLLIARVMIGLGVAAALMAGLKAIVMWFPRERVALVNGFMIMVGSLGAVTATAPAEWLIDWLGWRGLFGLLAIATLAVALLIRLAVPESTRPEQTRPIALGLSVIYTDPRFWRIAPLSASCVGSAWSLQALWAAPWLIDVEGLSREALIGQLCMMAIGMSVSAVLLGTIADRLRRHGIGSHLLLAGMAALFIGAELALALRLPLPSLLPWSVVSVGGAATVLSYATLAEYFPAAFAARANGSLNVLHFGWAFSVQYGTGLILVQWPAEGGHYPVAAYQVALGLSVAVQIVALTWFAIPWLRALTWRLAASFVNEPVTDRELGEAIIPSVDIAIVEAAEGGEW